ncbi:MAG: PAS domain S-box protein [Methylococcaceae bacterium]
MNSSNKFPLTYSDDLMRALNNAAIITETDLQGVITYANDKFCEISGYSQQELLGSTHSIVNSDTHSTEFFHEMWQTIRSHTVWFGEICNRKKTGKLYWLQAIILPITDKDGTIYKYVAIRFDITKRKKEEEAAQNRATLYRAVLEVTDGFCRVDYSGNFLEMSDGYCTLSGYSREELLGMNILQMGGVVPLNLVQFSLMLEGQGKTFEIEQNRKDNSVHNVEVTVSYSSLKDGSLFVFVHDITERKNLEKHNKLLLLQVAHMQKIDSIGRLTAGISHDFNNLLAGVLGYTELSQFISEELPANDLTIDLQRNLNQIKKAANRAAALIAQMMTYCRQEKNDFQRSTPERKVTHPLIREIVAMVRVGLTEKFHIELELDETLDIFIDASDLHQVLTNLLVNARDAMRAKGGVIQVKLALVELESAVCNACLENIQGEFIELSVSDSGTGIEEGTITKIFDPFFTTKSVGEGTGLGLSMVCGIVHRSHGHIFVESNPSEATTTFRLLFPVSSNVKN